MNTFVKKFPNLIAAQEEQKGHCFFHEYYQRIPTLISFISTDAQIVYENLGGNSQTVGQAINDGNYVELATLFSDLATICNTHAAFRKTEGGTKKFYLDRIDRLSNSIESMYTQWATEHRQVLINGRVITPHPSLINDLRHTVKSFSEGICVPSQGDIHERNLFTDHTVVDFEAAGWNLLSTDIATFVWHTLFSGNYFGPRYAKWATITDRLWLIDQEPAIREFRNSVSIKPSPQRADLVRQYKDTFVNKLTCLDEIERRRISSAICFRLLTTFPVDSMSPEDRHISFALANYFFSTPFVDSIDPLIDAQTQGSHDNFTNRLIRKLFWVKF